jgi:hypothetical protein
VGAVIDERFAFGLRIRSALELPELAPGGAGEPDVVVRLGDVPGTLVGGVRVGRYGCATPRTFLFEAPNVARYLVSDGAEVVVAPAAGAEPSHARTYLLGSVLGALCYQRGLVPLHANALAIGSRVVALAGASGAGKSTLAAHLSRSGYRMMGDDVCALSFEADGVMVWPGVRRFKLWADALTAFGQDTGGLERVIGGRDKYVLPHDPEDAPQAAPFRALYLLAKAAPGACGGIHPLGAAASFEALVANAYRFDIARAMGRRTDVMARAIETLRQASVYVFERRWGFDVLAEEAARLERHLGSGGP